MADLKIFRETVLPGSPVADAMYIIKPAAEDDYCEIYVTGTSGATIRRIPKESDIVSIVNSAVASINSLQIVADITARDALSLGGNGNVFVLVEDASGDATVNSGAALYAFDDSDDSFTKLTEYESLDLSVAWADIADKPSSSVANIDDAVTKRHAHSNASELDKVGEDVGGNFTYDGSRPTVEWASTGW